MDSSNIKLVKTKYGYIYVYNNDTIGRTFLSNKYYEDKIISIILSKIDKNKNIIDVGANIGSHTLRYSRFIGNNGKIYSFEPQKKVYDCLLKTINKNNLKNVVHYNNAVGNTNTKGSLQNIDYNSRKLINIGGISLGLGVETTEIKTIDSYNFKNIGFIKIDVEGAEKLVVLGAKKTIEKYRPIIFYEKFTKDITKDMIKICNLNEKDVNFNIKNYLLNDLKYTNYEKVGHNYIVSP